MPSPHDSSPSPAPPPPPRRPVPASREEAKVVISSTYLDNADRRRLLLKALDKLQMKPIAMERFVARAKDTVRCCEEAVRAADVFVGVIAHRYGWQPDSLDCSITEHEWRIAEKEGIPRLMFLIQPGGKIDIDAEFDPLPVRFKLQDRLLEFRRAIEQCHGVTRQLFSSDADLVAEVIPALVRWHDEAQQVAGRRDATATPAATPADLDLDAKILAYKQALIEEHSRIELVGFGKSARVKLRFDDLFVPQHTVLDHRVFGKECFDDAVHAANAIGPGSRRIPFADVFHEIAKHARQHHFVLLGDPGSGKTTQLKRTLVWLAKNPATTLGLPEGALPIFVPLRELAKVEGDLVAFADQCVARQLKTPPGFVQELAAARPLLFLLDGLDEVADHALREATSRWIAAAAKSDARHRFVVTCRYAGYDDATRLGSDFASLHLAPLHDEQVRDFIQRWFETVEEAQDPTDPPAARTRAAAAAQRLIDHLEKNRRRSIRIAEMARNPLLLTAVCLVHHDQKALPEKRVDLFEQCVLILLELWRKGAGMRVSVEAKDARRVLQPLARWMHQQQGRRQADAGEIAPILAPHLAAIPALKSQTPQEFLRKIRDESGLLVGWSGRRFGFLHLGFQEYLAARQIWLDHFERPNSGTLDAIAEHFGDSWWREVILLLMAFDEPALAEALFERIVERDDFWADKALVDDCLADAARLTPTPFLRILDCPAGSDPGHWSRQLAALLAVEPMAPNEIQARAAALAHHPYSPIRDRFKKAKTTFLLDPRTGLEFADIPAGEFVMGSQKTETGRRDNEAPHRVKLSAFRLSRTVVTNAHYQRFLLANPGVAAPEGWGGRRERQPHQPIVALTWDEAIAYAHWAGGTLPSESQWEYACRAGTTTRFWAGDSDADLARVGWHDGNSGGLLHAVAEKPGNGWGLYDMHGLVWEWCRDWYSADGSGGTDRENSSVMVDPTGPATGSARVLRGGSCWFDADRCRSAYRSRDDPSFRDVFIGFRVALPAARVAR